MINTQNIDDDECFKWCLVKYLNPTDHNARRITKSDKNFAKRLDFKEIKFPVKIKDIRKTEKYLAMKIKKNIKSKFCLEKHLNLVLIGERGKTLCSC